MSPVAPVMATWSRGRSACLAWSARSAAVTASRYASMHAMRGRINHRSAAAPLSPKGSAYSTRSTRRVPLPSGRNSWVCTQCANGPATCSSTNRRPAMCPWCSAVHRHETGPERPRSTVRAPSSIPPDRSSTSTRSQGGTSRSNAPGRACQAYTSAGLCGSSVLRSITNDRAMRHTPPGRFRRADRLGARRPAHRARAQSPVHRLPRGGR